METPKDLKPVYFALKALIILTSFLSFQAHARDPFPAVVFAEGLHLRSGPSGSADSLGVYTQGSQVEVLRYDPEWIQVRVNGQIGYMSRHYLTTPQRYNRALGLPPIQNASALPGSLPMVQSPGVSTHPSAVATNLPVVSNTPVQESPLPPIPPANIPTVAPAAQKMRVTATGLHLRQSSDLSSQSLGIFTHGTEVEVLPETQPNSPWVRVRVGDQVGSMWRGYLENAPATTTTNVATTTSTDTTGDLIPPGNIPNPQRTMYVSSSNGLNLRQASDTNSTILGSLPLNSQIEVLEITNGWARVRTTEGEGYMWAEHLADSRTEASAPTVQYANGECVDSFQPTNAADLALLEDIQRQIFKKDSLLNTTWGSTQSGTAFRFGSAGGKITVAAASLPAAVVDEIAASLGASPGTLIYPSVVNQINEKIAAGEIAFNTNICWENGKFIARLVGTNSAAGQNGYFEISADPNQPGVSMGGRLADSEIRRETYVSR